MIVVTSGIRYVDIDCYACIVAYRELLYMQGIAAVAISTAPLNESVTATLRALIVPFASDYQPTSDDMFVVMDVSDPAHFDPIVDASQVVEVFDHHPGFEAYWQERLGDKSRIERIGTAATLIYEAWQRAGMLEQMSAASAQLMAAAILDNTLNFTAEVTNERDHEAYRWLVRHADLPENFAATYFADCQAAMLADLDYGLKNDSKILHFDSFGSEIGVGQIVAWDAGEILSHRLPEVARILSGIHTPWFANIVSISDGCSYVYSDDYAVQAWLARTLRVTFDGSIAKASRLWLRKEILKASQA